MTPDLQSTICNEILCNAIKDYHENLMDGVKILTDVKQLDAELKDQPMLDVTLKKFNEIRDHLDAALVVIKVSTDSMQKLTNIAKIGNSIDPLSELQFERFSRNVDLIRLNDVLYLNSLIKSMVAFCGESAHTSHPILHAILNSISDLIYQFIKQCELEQVRIQAMLSYMANGLTPDDFEDDDYWDDDDNPEWM